MSEVTETIKKLLQANPDVNSILLELEDHNIHSRGLEEEDLVLLMNIVIDLDTKLTVYSRTKIIRNYVYFRNNVPTEIIIKILGKIRVRSSVNEDRALVPSLQVLLIEWIISVYSFLEPDIIERLYGMIFNFLEFEFLRPRIAYLLFLATKKKHINPRRVNRLINIYNKYGFSPEIVALLLTYQQFAPEQIFDTFPAISEKVFAHPNPNYLKVLIEIREKSKNHSLQSTLDEQLYVEEFERKLKRRKKSTATVDYSSLVRDSGQGGIPSLQKLASNIQNDHHNEEFSTLLANSHGYRLLSYSLKETPHERSKLGDYISLVLESFPEVATKEKLVFLESIKRYTEISSKVPYSIVENFLLNRKLIKNEDTQDYVWFFLANIDTTQTAYIKPILQTFETESDKFSVYWYSLYIGALSSLIEKLSIGISDQNSTIRSHVLNIIEFIIPRLSGHLKRYNYSRILVISTVRLLRSVQELSKILTIKHVVLPPSLVYPFLFITDPIAFSEICSYISFSKTIIAESDVNGEVTRLTDLHNSYLVDICNIIWRNKAFDTSKSSNNTAFGLSYEFINSLHNNLFLFDQNSTFKTLFNVHSSPAFAGYSANFVKELEEKTPKITTRHNGPLTRESYLDLQKDPESIWLESSYDDLRVNFLKELQELGYTGVTELLFTHLKSLSNR